MKITHFFGLQIQQTSYIYKGTLYVGIFFKKKLIKHQVIILHRDTYNCYDSRLLHWYLQSDIYIYIGLILLHFLFYEVHVHLNIRYGGSLYVGIKNYVRTS